MPRSKWSLRGLSPYVFSMGFATSSALWPIYPADAQDLTSELDAIEEPPEDDLSDLDSGRLSAPAPAPRPSPRAAPSADDLPPDDLDDDLDLDNLDAPGDDLDVPAGRATGDLSDNLDAISQNNASRPAEALTGVDRGPVGKVTSIGFRQLADRVRLTVRADRTIDWARELRSKRRQVIIELKNMTIARTVLKRPLDTGEFEGPVALVQPYESRVGDSSNVKILFQLRQFVDPTILRSGNDLYIDFPIVTDGNLFRDRSSDTPVIPKTFLSATGPLDFRGNKITLNVKNADLQDVLNLISRASGKDFIIAGGTNAETKVTLNVRNTPWDQVLSIILLNAKLGYQEIGNTYRIVPITELKTEIEDASKALAEAQKLRPLQTRLFPVNYAEANKIDANIKSFLTKERGMTAIDARTNSIVVTDLPEVLEKVARYIQSIDKQTSQVLIEGRIVEAQQGALKEFGLNWNVGQGAASAFDISGLNASVRQSEANSPQTGGLTSTISPKRGMVASGNIQIPFLTISATLAMLEEENKSKTIASPRITVLDNEQATISQGTKLLVQTVGADGVPSFNFQDAVLELKVTPQVTSDGNVLLVLNLKRDVPKGSGANTTIETRSATTQMLVESGKTAVIGGIYTDDTLTSRTGWPGLMKLPVFGALFKDSESTRKTANELLMFISPKILNAEKAFIVRSRNFDDQSGISAQGPTLRSSDEDVPDEDLF